MRAPGGVGEGIGGEGRRGDHRRAGCVCQLCHAERRSHPCRLLRARVLDAPGVTSALPPSPARRLWRYGLGLHLIKGQPVPRSTHIDPKADHLSFQVGGGGGGGGGAHRGGLPINPVGEEGATGCAGAAARAPPPVVHSGVQWQAVPPPELMNASLPHTALYIYTQADSLEAVTAQLGRRGIPYVQQRVMEDGMEVSQLFFHDPDNNMIEASCGQLWCSWSQCVDLWVCGLNALLAGSRHRRAGRRTPTGCCAASSIPCSALTYAAAPCPAPPRFRSATATACP